MKLIDLAAAIDLRVDRGSYILTGAFAIRHHLALVDPSHIQVIDLVLSSEVQSHMPSPWRPLAQGPELRVHRLGSHYHRLNQRLSQQAHHGELVSDPIAALCVALVLPGDNVDAVEKLLILGEFTDEQIQAEVLDLLGPYAVDVLQRRVEDAQWRLMTLEHTSEIS